jgi:hypothetical protein
LLDAHVAQGFGDLFVVVIALALALTFCWYLYSKKVFIRL